MDSVTQAVLGAAVADACLGKQLGRKAACWGLALGTLPDLDVLARSLMDATQFLSWHRGWSHGALAIVCGPIILTWLLRKIHGRDTISWRRGYGACVLIWLTHVLIDCFTVYGTGLWEPFSRSWVEFGLLFIIDPLYTLPLLVATVAALCFNAQRPWRRWCTSLALGLSTLYIGWAAIAKSIINDRFQDELQRAGISAERWQTAPSVANTFLWRCVVQAKNQGLPGYWIGYASLWDASDAVHWRWVPAHPELLADMPTTPAIAAIQWFSMGYWIVRHDAEGFKIADLRFGETTMGNSELEGMAQPWIFNWQLDADDDRHFTQSDVTFPPSAELTQLWWRIWGYRFPWETAAAAPSADAAHE